MEGNQLTNLRGDITAQFITVVRKYLNCVLKLPNFWSRSFEITCNIYTSISLTKYRHYIYYLPSAVLYSWSKIAYRLSEYGKELLKSSYVADLQYLRIYLGCNLLRIKNLSPTVSTWIFSLSILKRINRCCRLTFRAWNTWVHSTWTSCVPSAYVS